MTYQSPELERWRLQARQVSEMTVGFLSEADLTLKTFIALAS